jgi:hypothetical protein
MKPQITSSKVEAVSWQAPKSVDLAATNFLFLALGAWGALMPNPLETVWSVFMLWLLLRLFWWQNFPPILVYGIIMPWIEVHFSLYEANFYGQTLDELFLGTGWQTYWMASLGLLFVMLGMLWALKRKWSQLTPSFEALQSAAQQLDQLRIFIAIIGMRFLTGVLDSFIPYGSGLTQFVNYAYGIGEALACVLYLHFFLTRKRPLLFFGFFAFELVTSFYSYFGNWKGPIILLILASLVNIKKITTKMVLQFIPIMGLVFFLLFTWQAIKGDYREFLSGEQSGQVINVSQSEALSKFQELGSGALELSDEERADLLQGTFRRIGYLEYFAAAVKKVPSTLPYENGQLLKDNLTFAFVPRILNANKGVKDDKVKVEKYTDFNFGINSISSFSLGHYCEAYIDWGPIGMLLHLLIYGMIGSWLWYRVKKRYSHVNLLLFIGILWVVLLPWGTMQQDFITVAGKTTWGAICHLILFSSLYRWLNRFIGLELRQEKTL